MKKIITSIVLVLLIIIEPFINSSTSAFAVDSNTQTNTDKFDPFMKGTLESKQTTDLPWKNDADFLKVQKENKCPVLMAAYKTVLHDPLPGEEENVHLAARYVAGSVVAPGKVFSQNNTAGPYITARGYKKGPTYNGTQVSETTGGGVCKIASTLYNVAILSNLAIVERHNHCMPVPYVPYGQDATVYYGVKDFKFKNSTDYPILIWAKGIDNVLYIGFYGRTAPPKVTWSHEVVKVYKAPVYIVKNKNLPQGTVKVTHEGMDGAIIKSWLTITYKDGKSETKYLGKSCYEPLPFIKETSG